METITNVLSETHSMILSGKPEGHGWLLGIGVFFYYGTFIYFLWGLLKSFTNRDIWSFINPIEKVTHSAAMVAMACVPCMAVTIVYEVICRYGLNAPTIWAYEISYMLMGTSLMLGIGYCTQLRRNIRVDFYYDTVSQKQQSLFDALGFVLLLLPAASWISWALFEYFLEAYKVNERTGESAWNPLVWPFKFFFAFGFYLFTMQILAELIKCVLVLTGREVPGPKLPGGFE